MAIALAITVELVDIVPVDDLAPCCFLPSMVDVYLLINMRMYKQRYCLDCERRI